MYQSKLNSLFSIALLIAAATLTSGALAQYVWLDNNGVKQYSDMPPPASVPKARVLKAPSSLPAKPAPAAAATAPAVEGGNKLKGPPSLSDRNTDFNKRRTEQAEQAQKDAEAKRVAAEKSKACERAQQYQRTLNSGTPLASVDKNGQQILLDEKQRAQELRDAKNILKDCTPN
ncbi:MAG: DUF4124 domain-containing protein [Herbaspirillum sp.]